ncbi:phenylacetate-CoA ligase [Prosthecobacter fusiformis]|uniref:Phenylacetate-CoA ligase n=1 Tax=Prosthecobacter fusiformis TaxID=48464 RepID=A0A4R7RIW8_9BACT|nr:AMP-binding protein [Prosthecobacter fusiformis]TDU64048.1 phenylacetate-CoA ligase [Prosthecobacter fusiformis]
MADESTPLDRDRLRASQWRKLRSILLAVTAADGFYAPKFKAAGAVVSAMNGVEDFIQQVPFTTKDELLADRVAHPPFGTHLTQPLADYTRFCQTSGTSSGQPVAWLDTCESWEAMLACWRRVYEAADLEKGSDRIFFAFSFGPFLGFWTAYEAANGHYLSLPSGGLSSQARLEMMVRYGTTVLCCTPTYALRLGELIGEASGVEREALSIRKIIVAGEPGGSIPEVRARIEKLWNARVYDHHGMTEVGPVSYELTVAPGQLVVIEEAYLAEVIDTATGLEVADGEHGELVLTTLDRAAGPLLRYRTGDWVKKRMWNGRLTLEGGVLSRVDDMVVVRGVNVYPSAVEAVVRQFSEVVEFMVEQRKVEAMDEIELLIEVPGNVPKNLFKRLESKLRDTFSMRIPVRLVESDSLPRYEFKARRWRKV